MKNYITNPKTRFTTQEINSLIHQGFIFLMKWIKEEKEMTIRSRVITVWPQESIRQTSLSINGKKEDEDELRLDQKEEMKEKPARDQE